MCRRSSGSPDTLYNYFQRVNARLVAAKAEEIQKYSDIHDSKRFYHALKAVYGPQSSSTSPLLYVDGTTLITGKPAILNKLRQTPISTVHRARR